MKLKNTAGVVVGTLFASLSMGALAQGKGAVEMEAFDKWYSPNSERDYGTDGNLYGGAIGYYLTNNVQLALSYGEYGDMTSTNSTGNKDIEGSLTSLDAIYDFAEPGPGLHPYISAGFAHQSVSNIPDSNGNTSTGRNRSTIANLGTGLKYFFGESFFVKASVDGMYNLDQSFSEWMGGVSLGANFGGAGRPVEPAPAPEVCTDSDNDGVCDNVDKCPGTEANVTVDADGCPAVADIVRVELDVKFDFDKSVVKPEYYSEIQSVADFMKQYPQTTTTVEGYTDSVGTEEYNMGLSQRRADAVRQVMVDQYGVEANRISAVGNGENDPIADNATAEGRALNRRVEAGVEAEAK